MKYGVTLRVLSYSLNYVEGILKVYVFVIIFGLTSVLVAGTQLEKIFIFILSITPGVGLGKAGDFAVDGKGIVLFFLVWGLIFTLFTGGIKKFISIKTNYGKKVLLLFGLALHSVSMIVLSSRFGFNFTIVFIGISLMTFLLSVFFLRMLELFKYAINKIEKIN